MTTGHDHRVEKDSMGEVRVPSEAKWGAQTQRAIDNFPISGLPLEREMIAALAMIKGASAQVRAQRGLRVVGVEETQAVEADSFVELLEQGVEHGVIGDVDA